MNLSSPLTVRAKRNLNGKCIERQTIKNSEKPASRFRNGRLLRERRTLVFYALELRKTLQQLSHGKENQLVGWCI